MDFIIILLLCVVIFLLAQSQDALKFLHVGSFGKRKIILDSCALIDGRIIELVRTGFVADELVIPKFILGEMQMLADGNDAHKRERARFGLEVAAELQEYTWVQVKIEGANFPGVTANDDKLVKLAKKMRAVLCTNDYNLSKVASIEGIKVLNINDLTQGLRPVALPGEKLEVKIAQKGSNPQQGVGYLEDGTMIVVDGAANVIGSTVAVMVDRMHQTVSGKMVFGHIKQTRSHIKPKAVSAARRTTQPRNATSRSELLSKVLKKPAVKPRKVL
jgi:uncharacterized protein YacL